MQSSKLFRPLAQGLRPLTIRSAIGPASFARAISSQQSNVVAKSDSKLATMPKKMNILYAAMPQLVPFYFMNEVTVAFVLVPALIYVFSKYILPQKVRLMCARLFISKL